MKRFSSKTLMLTVCAILAACTSNDGGKAGAIDAAATARAEAGIFDSLPTDAPIATTTVAPLPTAIPTVERLPEWSTATPEPLPATPTVSAPTAVAVKKDVATATPDFAPLRCVTVPNDADQDGRVDGEAGYCTGGVFGDIPLP